jgi:ketosteroid isomerase-like protein
MSTDISSLADETYRRFSAGFSDGRWDEFFELVAEEVDFRWPAEPGAGHFTGVEGRQTFEQRVRPFGGESRITDVEPTARTIVGDVAIFEDEARGIVGGAPYRARHCLFFTFRDGRVVGFREYIAQVPADA